MFILNPLKNSAMSPVLAALFVCSNAFAHDYHAAADIVPGYEYDIAAEKRELDGPTETKGVAAVEKLGAIELGDEFPPMTGHRFRAREITIEPGGVIAVHQHERRPGFAYILEGEIIEHRNDHPEPLLRRRGDVAVERTGVTHWWENKSDGIVRALIVDIIPKSD
jgi:quercetin dioxygenase-like cupin family protein